MKVVRPPDKQASKQAADACEAQSARHSQEPGWPLVTSDGACPAVSDHATGQNRHRRSCHAGLAQAVTLLQAAADAAGQVSWHVSVDSAVCRAHQHAAGARKDRDEEREPPDVTPLR
jgi:hypothetical protein